MRLLSFLLFLIRKTTCSVDACQNCDSLAICQNNVCVCPETHLGTGLACLETSKVQRAVIPLSQTPTMSNGECTDPYWEKISSMGGRVSVILENYQTSWEPCVSMLQSNSILVYATIHAKNAQGPIMETYLKGQIDSLKTSYDGILIRNPGNKGFQQSHYHQVFSYAKSMGVKVGVDGYNNKYDASVAAAVDLIITFNDDIEFLSSNCGRHGAGIFCRNNNKLSPHDYEEIKSKLEDGQLKGEIFSAIVMNVPVQLIELTIDQARSEFGGGVFVSNHNEGNTSEPSYFNEYMAIFQNVLKETNRSGENCGCSPRDECSDGSHSCPANSDCTDLDIGYSCTCNSGWTEDSSAEFNCVDTDECSTGNHVCHSQAHCENLLGSYACQCGVGFVGDGKDCTDINECQLGEDDCDMNASCINNAGGFVCHCKDGFEGNGVSCSDIDECSTSSECRQNSKCTNSIGSYQCDCLPGFSDRDGTCSNIDECTTSDHNCDPFADCDDTSGSFTCTCKDGYEGDGTVCDDTNECELFLDDCPAHSTCQNTEGSFQCDCESGFVMKNEVCIDLDECKIETDNCSPEANCVNTVGSFTCECKEGFVGDGFVCDIDICTLCVSDATCNGSECQCPSTSSGTGLSCDSLSDFDETTTCGCQDNDECSLGTHDCPGNSDCNDLRPGYNCTCTTGYEQDKTQLSSLRCIDIDECASNEHNCDVNAECKNIEGSHACLCYTGFIGDGVSCSDKDECSDGSHSCHQKSSCQNSVGSYSCSCQDGFTGDGKSCRDFDECELRTDNCDNHASCTNNYGSYTCSCNVGYDGDGFSCDDINECSTNLDICPDQSTCSDTEGSYSCTCNVGFVESGSNCVDFDECASRSDNCSPDADCSNTLGSYECSCKEGFKGDGVACSLDICTLCDESATCNGTACTCPDWQSGSGVACDASSESSNGVIKSVIPLNKTPLTTGKTNQCSDSYWRKIAELGKGTAVLLQYQKISWLTCIEHLRASGVDVYVTVNGRKSQKRNMVQYFKDEMNSISADFNQLVNGIYIRNPGMKGFTQEWFDDVFDYAKAKGLKVALEGYSNTYTEKVVEKVDLIVTFRDNIDSFYQNCGSNGVGVFCKNNKLSVDQYTAIQFSISQGALSRNKFAAIVSNVPDSEIELTIFRAKTSLAGSVFVTDFDKSNSKEPTYFDQYVTQLKRQHRHSGSSSNCGCEDTDECAEGSHNCPNNSTCINENPGFKCECLEGYVKNADGHKCEDVDECSYNSQICNENSICRNTNGSYECICDDGYTGDGHACSDIDECDKTDTCHVYATCTNFDGTYACLCNSGFTGDGVNCDDVDECSLATNKCSSNSVCKNTLGSHLCLCKSGFAGDNCDDVDECRDTDLNNCHSQADCTNTDGSFSCSCKTGYSGDGENCVDVDECSDNTDDCDSNSGCVNTAGSFRCQCVVGFVQQTAGTCQDVDECVNNSHTCHAKAVCVNNVGSYDCLCINGFDGDGYTCSDVDECINGSVECWTDSACENIVGSYTCKCKEGFIDSNGVCTDYDECLAGSHLCDQNEVCVNSEGSFSCEPKCASLGCSHTCDDRSCLCPLGLELGSDGKNCVPSVPNSIDCKSGFEYDTTFNTCKDIDECNTEKHDCLTDQVCSNTEGSFECVDKNPCGLCSHSCVNGKCTCPDGFVLDEDGVSCSDKDECSDGSHSCHQESSCQNSVGSYSCSCRDGFTGDGKSCRDVDECELRTDNCDNHASCTNNYGSYVCSCNVGYYGDGFICKDTNECDIEAHNCRTDQLCTNNEGSFECIDKSPCAMCSHGCVDGECTCPDGLVLDVTERNCEITGDHVAIKCNSNHMEVLIDGDYLMNTDDLQLNDPACNEDRGNIVGLTDGDYLIRVALNECNNDISIEDGSITFSNTLYNKYETAATEENNGLIFKEPVVTVKFSCIYSTTVDVDGTNTVESSFLRGSASGKGDFDFVIETYSDPDFAIPASTGFKTGEIMYFDVKNLNPVDGFKFSVVQCAVYNEEKTESYLIIEDKCGDDYVATKHLDGYVSEVQARFSYTVFEFVRSDEDPGENQTIKDKYKCKITVCHENDINYEACVAPCPRANNFG